MMNNSFQIIASIATLILACVNAPAQVATRKATEQTFVAEKYLGKYDELEKNGYTIESGISVDIKRTPQALALSACQPFKEDSQVDCIFVVTEISGRDALGHAIRATPSDMIHTKLPKGWAYFDTGDTECKATQYPSADIVAIGQWVDRKKPLLGGYAHSLKKAWRIDYKSMRFVEISTQGVECGYNDDRD